MLFTLSGGGASPPVAAPVARPVVVALHAAAGAPRAAATAALESRPWGTEIGLRTFGLPPTRPGQVYEVSLVTGGTRLSAGTFTAPGHRPQLQVTLAAGARWRRFRTIRLDLVGGPAAGRGRAVVLQAPLPG
jgi:hypothetical protein